jgi:hypothetical protein
MQGTDKQITWALQIQSDLVALIDDSASKKQERLDQILAMESPNERQQKVMGNLQNEIPLLSEIKTAVQSCDQATSLIEARKVTVEKLVTDFARYKKNNSPEQIEARDNESYHELDRTHGICVWGLVRHHFLR